MDEITAWGETCEDASILPEAPSYRYAHIEPFLGLVELLESSFSQSHQQAPWDVRKIRSAPVKERARVRCAPIVKKGAVSESPSSGPRTGPEISETTAIGAGGLEALKETRGLVQQRKSNVKDSDATGPSVKPKPGRSKSAMPRLSIRESGDGDDGTIRHSLCTQRSSVSLSLKLVPTRPSVRLGGEGVVVTGRRYSSDELHPEMRRKDLIESLIKLISAEEAPEVQDEAAFALASLAKDCKIAIRHMPNAVVANKSDIRKSGGVKSLVRLLESNDPDVKKNAALAISILLEDCKSNNNTF
ncbi:hypothetical protein HDU96_000279 [Phlyctochytrium bullatum]|nr:hypothetical protein HDU96_000279 [Phlyctochytrium bullatum]